MGIESSVVDCQSQNSIDSKTRALMEWNCSQSRRKLDMSLGM